MNHFKEFILAIQTFNLETLASDPAESSISAKQEIQEYSISRENGYKTNAYRNHLNALKELAIMETVTSWPMLLSNYMKPTLLSVAPDIHRQQDRFVIKPTLRTKKNQQFE